MNNNWYYCYNDITSNINNNNNSNNNINNIIIFQIQRKNNSINRKQWHKNC